MTRNCASDERSSHLKLILQFSENSWILTVYRLCLMNDFNFFRLSYHQFLVENIPEGLHGVLPAVPTPNYRYSDEEGMNFRSASSHFLPCYWIFCGIVAMFWPEKTESAIRIKQSVFFLNAPFLPCLFSLISFLREGKLGNPLRKGV